MVESCIRPSWLQDFIALSLCLSPCPSVIFEVTRTLDGSAHQNAPRWLVIVWDWSDRKHSPGVTGFHVPTIAVLATKTCKLPFLMHLICFRTAFDAFLYRRACISTKIRPLESYLLFTPLVSGFKLFNNWFNNCKSRRISMNWMRQTFLRKEVQEQDKFMARI